MDFWAGSGGSSSGSGARRRPVNLAGGGGGGRGRGSGAGVDDGRGGAAGTVEAARREREQRLQHRRRDAAAKTLQTWYRGRRRDAQTRMAARAAWDTDVEGVSAVARSGGTGPTAAALQKLVGQYLFFSRIAPPRRPGASRAPLKQSPAGAALILADETRFRHLVRLLLASLRASSRQHHLGALIVTPNAHYAAPSAVVSTAASTAALAVGLVSVPAEAAAHWLWQMRRVCLLLLEHIGNPQRFGMESVGNEILLLWHLLDANQWPFVKAGPQQQATPSERALILQTQAALMASLVAGHDSSRQFTESTATATAMPSSISDSSAAAAASPIAATRGPSSSDVFLSLRTRILDLTSMDEGSASAAVVATPAQIAHKTSVALLFAIVLRCVSLSASLNAAMAHRALASFVLHIFSIPALPQRLRFIGLAALLPSFLTPSVFDRTMETLSREATLLTRQLCCTAFTFACDKFSSPSFVSHDSAIGGQACDTVASRARKTPRNDELDAPSSAVSSSSTAAAASSSSVVAAVPPTNLSASPASRVVYCLCNCLEFVTLLDECKSDAASRSFSLLLAAVGQLLAAVPDDELPVLGRQVPHARTSPLLTHQFSIFTDRGFLDRLCRRLLSEPALAAPALSNASGTEMRDSSHPSASSAAAINDVPVVCTLLDSMLFRWGPSSNAVLNTLVFSNGIVKPLWNAVQHSGILQRIDAAAAAQASAPTLIVDAVAPPSLRPLSAAVAASSLSASGGPAAVSLSSHPLPPQLSSHVHPLDSVFTDRYFSLLPLFCTCYSHFLVILDDDEFFVRQTPFSLAEDVPRMVAMLKALLFHLFWAKFSNAATPARLRDRFSKLFIQLRDRQSRRPFLPPHVWLFAHAANAIPVHTLQAELAEEQKTAQDLESMEDAQPAAAASRILPPGRASALIRSIPFVLPFSDRVRVLYGDIESDKMRLRSSGIQFDHGLGRHINVRRSSVLEDAFEALHGLTPSELKGRIQVHFTDEHGLQEAGVDGGGLWKELLTLLFQRAFHPSSNLFAETSEHYLYPNPRALDLPLVQAADSDLMVQLTDEHVEQTLGYFHFVGAMCGKALWDGIQIDAQLALFFLRFCVGLPNSIDDLAGLDSQIYASLMKLKSMNDAAAIDALDLTFSVDRQAFGVTRSVDLIPGGAAVPVTSENKIRFIYAMSDYYLNQQMKRQATAFQQGLASVVNPLWLRMFAAEELRLLLSGSQQVDLDDLRAHTSYSSGYTDQHEVIRWLWEVLREFSGEEVALFLRFCTSCSRAPLLGFKHLSPLFAVQRVNVDALEANLPTASTCMNLLRLPRYNSKQRLRDKLLYAITAASHGFGLT